MKTRLFFSILILFGLVLITYGNTFQSPLNFDDEAVIRSEIASSSEKFFRFSPPQYRHLFYLSLALNHKWGSLSPIGYHFFNTLIHFITGCILFFITYLTIHQGMGKGTKSALSIAGITSILYVLNPVHTEAVTYISGRASGLSGLFYFSSLLFFILGSLQSIRSIFCRVSLYLLSLFAFVLAILSKETSVTLPLVILLYDICFMRNKNWRAFKERLIYLYLPIPIAGGLLIVGSPLLLNTLLTWLPRIDFSNTIDQAGVVMYAFRLILFPMGLTFDHYSDPDSIPIIPAGILRYLSPLLILSAAFLIIKNFKKVPSVLTFSFFWYLITLAPTNSVLFRLQWLSERNLYVPAFGVCLLLATSFHSIIFQNRKKSFFRGGLGAACLLAVLILSSVLLISRNSIYRSNIMLWEDTVEKVPENSHALYNLSHFYLEKEQYSKALVTLNRMTVSKASPFYLSQAHSNLGAIYSKMGNSQRAKKEFLEGIRLDRTLPIGYFNLGTYYALEGQFERAIAEYEKAEQRYEEFRWGYSKPKMLSINKANAHHSLGILYLKKGNLGGALREFEQAIALNPTLAKTHYNIGRLLLEMGKDHQKIKEHLEEALKWSKHPTLTHNINALMKQVSP